MLAQSIMEASHWTEVDPLWTYINVSIWQLFREFVGMQKISRRVPQFMPIKEKQNQSSHDGLQCPYQWPDVFTMFLQCFYDHFQTLRQWEACTMMPTQTPRSAKFLCLCAPQGSISAQYEACIKETSKLSAVRHIWMMSAITSSNSAAHSKLYWEPCDHYTYIVQFPYQLWTNRARWSNG